MAKVTLTMILAEIKRVELRLSADMRAGLTALREEMHAGDAALREEMRTGVTALRGEMQAGDAALREEMCTGLTALREEMCTGLTALRGEMQAGDGALGASLRKEMQEGFAQVTTRLDAVVVDLRVVREQTARNTEAIVENSRQLKQIAH